MALNEERLVAVLEARIDEYERKLRRASVVGDQQFKKIETRGKQMERQLALSGARGAEGLTSGLKTLAALTAGGAAVDGLVRLSDAATRVDNALKTAGLSGEELERIYQSLYASALKNSAPLEDLTTLYSRASQAQKELGASSAELTRFTDNVALALRVSGKSATESAGALQQLGQLLGGARVQAEEFNSIQDGAPAILQAVAAGLDEAGGSVSRLKALVNDGKVSNQAFFRAFEAGAVILESKVAGSVMTTGQAWQNLNTALINSVRDFNNATKAGENLARGINRLAQEVDDFDVAGFIDKIARAKAASDEWLRSLGNAEVFQDLNRLLGVADQNGQLINPDVAEAEGKIAGLERDVDLLQKAIAQNTELGFDNSGAIARLAEVRGELARLRAEAQGLPAVVQGVRPSGEVLPFPGDNPNGTNGQMGGPGSRGGARRVAPVKPVSLADFPVVGASDKAGSKSSKSDGYKSAIEDLTRETAALEQKRAALAALNPLAADYAQQVDAVEAAQRLLTEAQEAGKAVGTELSDVQRLLTGDLTGLTPAAKAQAEAIRDVALANAAATASYEALQKKQQDAAQAAEQAVQDRVDFQKNLVSSGLTDIRSAFEDGKITAQEWGDVLISTLDRVAAKLQESFVDSLFDGGGLLSTLLGGAATTAGSVGGGVAASAGNVPQVSRTAAALAAPAPSTLARTASVAVDVGVGIDDDGKLYAKVKNIAQNEGRQAAAQGIGIYRANQFHADVQAHLARPRVRGK